MLYSFFWGDFTASEFYVPTFRNILYHLHIECSETSAHKIQTPGNHPKERIQHVYIFSQALRHMGDGYVKLIQDFFLPHAYHFISNYNLAEIA